jgi:hypothetical protein
MIAQICIVFDSRSTSQITALAMHPFRSAAMRQPFESPCNALVPGIGGDPDLRCFRLSINLAGYCTGNASFLICGNAPTPRNAPTARVGLQCGTAVPIVAASITHYSMLMAGPSSNAATGEGLGVGVG